MALCSLDPSLTMFYAFLELSLKDLTALSEHETFSMIYALIELSFILVFIFVVYKSFSMEFSVLKRSLVGYFVSCVIYFTLSIEMIIFEVPFIHILGMSEFTH
jgi:hypothetical protein